MQPRMYGPLQGLRVVELAQRIAGPYCGKLLADLGAEVVKVEPPEGDVARRRGPFPGDPSTTSGQAPSKRSGRTPPDLEKSGLFLYLNTNKRGVTLEPGSRQIHNLLQEADILVEDYTHSRVQALGLSFEALHARHPRLILVSVTPFGNSGPYREDPATDLTLFHGSGVAYETPQHGVSSLDLPPLVAGGSPSSFLAGGVAATAAMAAVFAREGSGQGQQVDVSHLEALTGIMTRINMHQATYEGKTPSRLRHAERQVDYVPCEGGYVNIQVHFPHWWQALVKAMGDPPWAKDPLFENTDFRDQGWDIIAPLLADWAKDYTRQDLFDYLQRHHVPCLPGYSFSDVVEDPHLKARGFWSDVSGFRMPGPPYRFSLTPWAIRRPAPRLGEHNAEVLSHESNVQGPKPKALGAVSDGERGSVPSRTGPETLDPEPQTRGPLPLEGIRVLDFTWVFAGPTCTMLLAASGAEVIKVETRKRPDSTRRQRAISPTGKPEPSTGGGFDGLNFSKRAITLNLAEPRAIDLVKRLVSVSDVLVQNYSYGVMERFGIGYDDLVKVRPDLVMLSMSLFGGDGPYRDYFGYGGPLPVFTGLASVTGYPGGLPQTVGASWPDPLNGVSATFAILAALHHRQRTGEGQHIDLSMAEGSIATLPDGVMEYTMNGRVLGLEGNRDRHFAPHNVYRCRGEDQWVAVAVETEKQWHALCEVTGLPEGDPRFASLAARKRNEDALDALIEAWSQGQDKHEVSRLLRARGVPAAASLNRAEVLEDPHLRDRGAFVPITRASGTEQKLVPALPWHGIPARYAKPPNLGEDNEYVFGELLGLKGEALQALQAQEVVY